MIINEMNSGRGVATKGEISKTTAEWELQKANREVGASEKEGRKVRFLKEEAWKLQRVTKRVPGQRGRRVKFLF